MWIVWYVQSINLFWFFCKIRFASKNFQCRIMMLNESSLFKCFKQLFLQLSIQCIFFHVMHSWFYNCVFLTGTYVLFKDIAQIERCVYLWNDMQWSFLSHVLAYTQWFTPYTHVMYYKLVASDIAKIENN